jgi:hypothetical protein
MLADHAFPEGRDEVPNRRILTGERDADSGTAIAGHLGFAILPFLLKDGDNTFISYALIREPDRITEMVNNILAYEGFQG